MKRPSNFVETLNEFIGEIKAILDLVEDFSNMLEQSNTLIETSRSKLRMEQIHEFAFLRLILSWEEFLERTLVLYMMGKKSAGGYQLDVKVKNIEDEEIAYILLSGKRNFDINRDYLPYLSDPRDVKKIANALFHSHCYDFSDLDSALFDYARYIRNGIAHRSPSSKENFRMAVEHFVGKKHDCAPGELLLEKSEEDIMFGNYLLEGGYTYFGYYCLYFAYLAREIVYYKKSKNLCI